MVSGQVYLSGMLSNPVIESYVEENGQGPQYKSVIKEYIPVDLPFSDDFSYAGVYPDSTQWIDKDVYVNAHYPVYPIDYGVATFDVLDATGRLYPSASPFAFIADRLTSYPIKLGNNTPADSIYLSFYYQPQGRGDVPLSHDSLVLEFGFYNGDSSFVHYDSVLVYGDEFPDMPSEGYFLPGDRIAPPAFICDTGLWTILTDTLFYYDSLLIPCDSVFVYDTDWTPIWSAEGDTLLNFVDSNKIYFKQIMIPVADTQWFRDDFQFRFYNWASLSVINSWQSNTDHWHIDKVYLNANRTFDDIFTDEIRFVEPGVSLISGYYSMPMWQYELEMMKDSFNVYVNNNNSSERVCTYKYTVYDDEGSIPGFAYDGFTNTLMPYADITISNYGPFVKAPVISWYDFQNKDEFEYFVEHVVYDENDQTVGDTVLFEQKFSNYFAYDDGTAERSYGASATGTKMVVRFKINQVDTLRGVQIFFNRTQNNANDRYFNIAVWNDNFGEPGQLIGELEKQKPQFNKPNEFYTYVFPDSVDIIKLGVGTYYVGVIQTTNDNLNIGFDRNTNNRSRTLYTTDGNWHQSPFDGTLMIRPVVGRSIIESEPPVKKAPANLTVYPNPSRYIDYVTVDLPSNSGYPKYKKYMTLRVFDLAGKLIYSAPYEEQLDISWFKNGFYILNVFNSAYTEHYTTKLIIAK